MRENDRGRYTIPSNRLYPHQWAWDSGFAAIGWAHLDIDRASLELETLFEGQWDDGRIPHIIFHKDTPDYFPGPKDWGAGGSSSISNPPIWTLAAERILELGGAEERVKEWLPKIERSHLYLIENRDPLKWDVIATCHPWENGQDNCPAWDQPLLAVDPDSAPPFKRVDKEKVEDASQRPTDTQYKRYMALVKAFKENGFQMADFAVYDPFFTTLTIAAELALARMARKLNFATEAEQRAAKLQHGLASKLWSEDLGRYRYYDARSNGYLDPFTIGSLAPVIVEAEGSEELVRQLKEDFKAAWGLPTMAPSSTDFDPVCYWRGPTWININWLFRKAIETPTLDLVAKSGFWEYFHPETGKGLGTDRFTWTAALVLDLLNEGGA